MQITESPTKIYEPHHKEPARIVNSDAPVRIYVPQG